VLCRRGGPAQVARPRHERQARGTPVPHTVAADGALRENRDCLSCIEHLPHPCESESIALATLNPDRAKPVKHPVMIRCDDHRPGDGESIGADHLESIHGEHYTAP
jgi:hypothetical protein